MTLNANDRAEAAEAAIRHWRASGRWRLTSAQRLAWDLAYLDDLTRSRPQLELDLTAAPECPTCVDLGRSECECDVDALDAEDAEETDDDC